MAENTGKSFGEAALEAAVSEAARAIGGPAGGVVVTAVSKFGKQFLAYWQSQDRQQAEEALVQLSQLRGGRLPPFAVIGLGRCGSRVTAQLARMVVDAQPSSASTPTASTPPRSFLAKLFNGGGGPSILTVEPFMVIGDIDETTFGDIDGILSNDEAGKGISERIVRLNYAPLASGGAGNIPIFGEFLTRGLLLLPPQSQDNHPHGWKLARTYLVDACARQQNPTRLVFYVFSAGGGTGGGSAHEIMRAQRFAMSSSSEPDPETYFTGVAVLPYEGDLNRTREINAGRAFVQYLANLNIKLDVADRYRTAAHFDYELEIKFKHGIRTITPWDSLAVISNNVMSAGSEGTREKAEQFANQYIAQQIFNLAAAQLPTLAYLGSTSTKTSELNYSAIRLDPADLRTSLAGPYAIAFGVALPEDSQGKHWLDALLIRSLQLPRINAQDRKSGRRDFVEGISISPEDEASYVEKLDRLSAKVKPAEGNPVELSAADFSEVASIPMFHRCPRAVFVFTAPQDSDVPPNVDQRLARLLTWLMPNLVQPRFALIRGTTAYYTLSVYLEGSVVLAPEVEDPIFNYLWLCWEKNLMDPEQFNELFDSLIEKAPPLDDKAVSDAIGNQEAYGRNIVRFEELKKDMENRWSAHVTKHAGQGADRDALISHKVADCFISPSEVAAALRYLNYIGHVASLKPRRRSEMKREKQVKMRGQEDAVK